MGSEMCIRDSKINDEELPIVANLFGLDSPGKDIRSQQRAMRTLCEMFDLDVAILTAGDAYSIVMGHDEISILPTPQVEVADTVGAGDSFSGAFLAYLLRGFAIPAAHRRAVDVSAFVCSQSGAWPRYPQELREQQPHGLSSIGSGNPLQ